MSALAPLDTLYEAGCGPDVPLPPTLAALYGRLPLSLRARRPYVIANFVTTLDGVVALNGPDPTGGGDISGFNPHDRMVMGLLRALADAVIVGAGTVQADPAHLWTPAHIYPALAEVYQDLRVGLGKPEPPLTVVVTARGEIDTDRPAFQTCAAPALIVTTAAGVARLRARRLPPWVQTVAVQQRGSLSAAAILDAVRRVRKSDVILVEGGPWLLGGFFAQQRLDELFLTLAPQVAGRDDTVERPGLVTGHSFAPERPRWGTLSGIKRAGSHLFLRYRFDPLR